MVRLFSILILPLVISSCIRQSPSEQKADYPGLIGGWYKSVDLERLANPFSLKSMYQLWDEENNFGSSWSAQWEGYLQSPASGAIVLYAQSNHELRVSIDGKEVLSVDKTIMMDSIEIHMKKGDVYSIHLEYMQHGKLGADGKIPFFSVSWNTDGEETELIPLEAIYFTEDQNIKWNYIGENYGGPFSYLDKKEYELDPIRIRAPELEDLDFSQSTGGLPLVNGVETYEICRANREDPESAEGKGYTYQHHQDLAIWKGLMYVGWNTCEVDEDTYPSRELLSTSSDGENWSRPVEMFPEGISTPLRMYFFLAPNGRMLLIAGLRESFKPLTERKKSGLVVREIKEDHGLGEVYTLRNIKDPVPNQPPFFESAGDAGFVEACRQLLDDHLYLSQQDYGNLLDPGDRMKWFDPANWEGSDLLRDMASEFGKGMCFFERKDGTLVSVSKFRWVTTSSDGGKTWKQPVRAKSLITGWGKVWAQSTVDGKYILIYNPHPDNRWPLLMLTSEDGITFSHPKSVNGPLPSRRYAGKYKDAGVSYHRGLSHWNNDGTWSDDDIWLVYSLNKEDIRISRIPVPIRD